jgi:hypothetical protein
MCTSYHFRTPKSFNPKAKQSTFFQRNSCSSTITVPSSRPTIGFHVSLVTASLLSFEAGFSTLGCYWIPGEGGSSSSNPTIPNSPGSMCLNFQTSSIWWVVCSSKNLCSTYSSKSTLGRTNLLLWPCHSIPVCGTSALSCVKILSTPHKFHGWTIWGPLAPNHLARSCDQVRGFHGRPQLIKTHVSNQSRG